MSQLVSKGPHAYQSRLPFGSLDYGAIREVSGDAVTAAKLRSRVLCHQALADSPQEMIICLEPRTYIRPHRHLNRAESGLALAGVADAVFFDETGDIMDAWPMGTLDSGLRFFYRIQEPVFHCLLVRQTPFVFHEVSTGPYANHTTEFGAWTPPEEDVNSVSDYLNELSERLENYYRRNNILGVMLNTPDK